MLERVSPKAWRLPLRPLFTSTKDQRLSHFSPPFFQPLFSLRYTEYSSCLRNSRLISPLRIPLLHRGFCREHLPIPTENAAESCAACWPCIRAFPLFLARTKPTNGGFPDTLSYAHDHAATIPTPCHTSRLLVTRGLPLPRVVSIPAPRRASRFLDPDNTISYPAESRDTKASALSLTGKDSGKSRV